MVLSSLRWRLAIILGLAAASAASVSAGPPAGQSARRPDAEVSAPPAQADAPGPARQTFLNDLRRASCTEAARAGEAIRLEARPVPLQSLNPGRRTIGQLTYLGGFDLTSDDERFGGLSGLDFLDDRHLLAVSDKGAFIWIDLAADGVAPTAARAALMTDAGGKNFAGKSAGDAEGLAILGDIALVSFEGDHRVLAYDIGACGAAARGVPLGWSLTAAFSDSGLKVESNSGVEALGVTADGYLFAGIETAAGGASPLSIAPVDAPARFDQQIGANAPPLVGLDLLPGGPDGRGVRAFSLHRSTRPLANNAISIFETDFEPEAATAGREARRFRKSGERMLAQMNMLVTIDNFEGIAARATSGGAVRLVLISDNNFSRSQRTLMMVFELAPVRPAKAR